MGSKHVDEIPSKHLIVIRNKKNYIVKAPMPDNFTIGAGGEVTSPFSGFAADGTAASIVSLYTGASQKTGLLTRRLWMGPDQPDISITLNFEAYYSAFDEVIEPTFKLMLMSTGDEEKPLKESPELLAAVEQTGIISEQRTKDLTDLVSFLRAPDEVVILVGDYLRIRDAIISSVSVSYSNVLDAAGLPMSAEASVTLTPSSPFTQSEVDRMFTRASRRT